MLLLDKAKKPEGTVYYLSAISYGFLRENDGLDFSGLQGALSAQLGVHNVNGIFLEMAIDFLYLLDKIDIDERGGLHVH